MATKMRVRSENFLNKSLVFELKDSNNGYAINSKKKGNSKLQSKSFLSLPVVSNIRPFDEYEALEFGA